jgi:putative spermidine/putrescine transport system substrate-binding protein
MTCALSRRSMVQGLAAAGSAAALPGMTFAQSRAIATTSFPGAWEQAFRTIVIPEFRKRTQATVNLVPSIPVDTLSKLLGAKNNPPYDVVVLDEGPYLAALQHDIFEKIPAELVPNMRDMPAKFVDPRGLGVFISAQIIGIAYNPEKIKTPPRSWNDLLKPEYKGRVGLSNMAGTLVQAWMVEIARLNGGNEENMEPAFDFVKRMLPNLSAITPSPGALATLFQQGQVDIAVHYNNNVGDLQAKGVPIELAKPDTGFAMIRSTAHIIKNGKNPDLAAAYINTIIDPEVQAKLGSAPYYLVTTNSKVPFSPGLQKHVKDMAELETFKTVDWLKFNPHYLGYIDRFNREIRL